MTSERILLAALLHDQFCTSERIASGHRPDAGEWATYIRHADQLMDHGVTITRWDIDKARRVDAEQARR